MGIIAQCAMSGHEAVRAVLEAHEADTGYDVCIIDWRMLDMDGVEVTKKIREKPVSYTHLDVYKRQAPLVFSPPRDTSCRTAKPQNSLDEQGMADGDSVA